MAKSNYTYDIFISYAREESRFVDRLAEQLDRSGYRIFVDREEVRGGEAWRLRIAEAISASRAFILVISPSSAASPMVTKEMALAHEARTRILPVIRERAALPPDKVYFVDGINYIDFTRDFDSGMRSLFAALAPPADSGKVLAGKARSAARTSAYAIAGVLGLAVLALLCYGAYLLAAKSARPLSQAPLASQSSPPFADTPPPVANTSTPIAAQPNMQDFFTAPTHVQQNVAALLAAAATDETQAYLNQNASLAAGSYTGDALINLKDQIDYWTAQGLVRAPTFYPQNSRILAYRQIDGASLLVWSCEVWAAYYTQVAGLAYVGEDPQQVFAKQFTIDSSSGDWQITRIEYFPPPNFCS